MKYNTEDLKLGQFIICDEGGSFKTAAIVVKEAHIPEDPMIQFNVVVLEDIKTGKRFTAGGIPPFCPAFYGLEEFLSWYPPENREKLKEKLGVKDE